eukprot:m.295090 g.295090  ORF g.295090 m.295090 type:complete len:249 (+) comp15852_c0_seq2:142-888(+)
MEDLLLTALSGLNVGDVNGEWVVDAWSASLCDLTDTFPGDLPEIATRKESFMQLAVCLEKWRSAEATKGTFWPFLAENNLDFRALVALMALEMQLKDGAEVAAATAYMRILALPGATAHKLFNPIVMRAACDAVESLCETGITKRRANGGGNKRKASKQTGLGKDGSDDEGDDAVAPSRSLPPRNQNALSQALHALLILTKGGVLGTNGADTVDSLSEVLHWHTSRGEREKRERERQGAGRRCSICIL